MALMPKPLNIILNPWLRKKSRILSFTWVPSRRAPLDDAFWIVVKYGFCPWPDSNMGTSIYSISPKETVACFAGRGQVSVFLIKTHYKSLPCVPQAGEIGHGFLLMNFWRSPYDNRGQILLQIIR